VRRGEPARVKGEPEPLATDALLVCGCVFVWLQVRLKLAGTPVLQMTSRGDGRKTKRKAKEDEVRQRSRNLHIAGLG